MKYIIQLITLIALVFTANTALAKGGGKPPPAPEPSLMNVVTVSPMYGDFTSPVEAINSILDASAINPYLIQIGPGVYELGTRQIVMKEWVTIQGSGQDATKITGLVSSGSEGPMSAIVVGSDDAAISNMTIENAGGTVSIAIYNFHASPRIEQVNAIASGTSSAYGIYNSNDCSPIITNVIATASANSIASVGVLNFSNSSPSMTNVTASGSGGYYAHGIRNLTSSSPTMTNVTAEGIDGATSTNGVLNEESSSPRMINVTATASSSEAYTNSGVYNDNSSPTMINVTANASGGMHSIGVFSLNGSSPVMTGVIASASGGTYNYGVNSTDYATPFIQDSILEGVRTEETNSFGVFISENSPGTRVVNNKIINGIYNDADGSQCRGNYDADLVDVPCKIISQ